MPDSIIVDTATRIFRDLCEADTVNKAEKGEWPTALWDALEESGLPLTWVPDEFGGAGAEIADGFAVLRDYDGPVIHRSEWEALTYLDWKSGGDTNFAPLASARASSVSRPCACSGAM